MTTPLWTARYGAIDQLFGSSYINGWTLRQKNMFSFSADATIPLALCAHGEIAEQLVAALARWGAASKTTSVFVNAWEPIAVAPWNIWVEIRGPSGYTTPKFFLTLARREKGVKSGDWYDVQRDRLMDYGWLPTEWRYTEAEMG
jgi:hypothetical protein